MRSIDADFTNTILLKEILYYHVEISFLKKLNENNFVKSR